MMIAAFCAAEFAEATRRAAGVEPLTCPPVDALSFQASWLERHEFLYFDLHGEPGQRYWFGDDGLIALTARTVREANLWGAVVFAASCYLGETDSPMLDALLAAGAGCVIGGSGKNWGPRGGELYGAPLLGLWVRRLVRSAELSPGRALWLAKRCMRLGRGGRSAAARDAMQFRMYVRREG